MKKTNVTYLKSQIKELSRSLAKVANNKDFQEFLKLVHKPGWTTEAEILFVTGVVDLMLAQTKALGEIKQVLVTGSRAVALSEKTTSTSKNTDASIKRPDPLCRGICGRLQKIVDAMQDAAPGDIPNLIKQLKSVNAQISQHGCNCDLQ